jgi:hypothetical protein
VFLSGIKGSKGVALNVEVDERSVRPRSYKTDESIEKLRNILHSDRHLSIRVMALQLNLDKETVKKS